ncbi:P-loop containing nucleoside triphosphate hydrolase protein [Limtongia smithiae]|uniref:P-loop containing nucleoside triphosphate hydrolase protein n=1 Tax=Limtongia smithiae TaxID=1125753 RepID=UPI0034D013C4
MRRSAYEDADEDDYTSPVDLKRRRVSSDLSGASVTSSSSPIADERLVGCAAVGDATIPRHAPGAIVRVKLHNFVTYTSAEFYLGPNLNMIIGPNGTGKSTFVCAVCLGMGGKPEILGRAKDIGEYVKLGETKGTIELEIQGRPGERNPVIERAIYKDNKSEWSLDGKRDTAKNVKELIDSYSVQIDNLCQFLPQDKVAEFAHMTPQRLLIETERATGSPEMLPRHESLINLHEEYKIIAESQEEDMRELARLTEAQEKAEEEVQQFRMRERLGEQIKRLEQIRPAVKLQSVLNESKEAQAIARQKKLELDTARANAGPSAQLKDEANVERSNAEDQLAEAQERYERAQKRYREMFDRRDDFDSKIQDAGNDIKSLEKKSQKLKKDLERARKELDTCEQKLERKPSIADREQNSNDINENNDKQRNVNRLLQTRLNENYELELSIKKLEEKLTGLKSQVEDLDSASARKMAHLKRFNIDTFNAVVWLRKNRHLFQHEVFEPPILSVTVNDPRKANAVETVIHKPQALTFTCLSREDYVTFTTNVLDRQGFNVAVTEFSKSDKPNIEAWTPQCTNEQLRNFGLECWITDLISGPAPVLNMLCHQCNIMDVAYSSRTLTALQKNKIDKFTRPDGTLIIAKYVAGNISVYAKHSMYGNREVSKNTQVVSNQVNIFNADNVDLERRESLVREIAEDNDRMAESVALMREKKAEHNDLKNQLDQLIGVGGKLKRARQALKQEALEYVSLQTRKESLEDTLHELENTPDTSKSEIAQLRETMKQLYAERLNFGAKLVDELYKVWGAQKTLVSKAIDHGKKKSDFKELDDRYRQANQHIAELEQEYVEAKAVYKEKKAATIELKEQLSEELSNMSDEEQQELMKLLNESNQLTIEGLEEKLNALQEQYDQFINRNGHVVENYERRAKEIEHLQKKVDTSSAKVDALDGEIKEIHAAWVGELEVLVARISHEFSQAFKAIGCAGTIGIGKHEDYDKWCIEIKVRFREHEQLQLLTHQRQSGGERSVSTIFYLMSLQGVTKAPFRVVDEINQGMDPRNERMVHSRMVQVACQESSSQYFLITPKLLPGLDYHERMVVHCIYSGKPLPRQVKDLGRLGQFAEIGRQLRGISVK